MNALPAGWARATLEDVCVPRRVGVDPKVQRGRPFIGLEHIESHTTKLVDVGHTDDVRSLSYEFRTGDTLYSRLRPYLNKVHWARFDGLGSGELMIFPPSKQLAPRFLTYVLNQPRFLEFTSKLDTGDRPRVSWDQIKAFSFDLPPAAEQERIVLAIEQEFSRIEAGQAALIKTKARLVALRQSALQGLFRGQDGSEWPEVALEKVLVRGRYGTSTKCSYQALGQPVLRIPNIQSGVVDTTDLKFAEDTTADFRAFLLEAGDVLVVRTNGSRSLIGRSAVAETMTSQFAYASYLINLRFDTSRVVPRYVSAVMAAPLMRMRIEGLAATTAGQYNLSLSKLRRLQMPVPPIDEQMTLLEHLQDLERVTNRQLADVAVAHSKAMRLRSAILGAALAGRLTKPVADDSRTGAVA